MSQKCSSCDIWWISKSFPKHSKPAILTLLNGPELLSSVSDKAKLYVEIFSKGSNLDYLGSSLPVFFSRIDLKLCNIFVTSRSS